MPDDIRYVLAACGHTTDAEHVIAGHCEDCWIALHPDEDADLAAAEAAAWDAYRAGAA